MGWLLCRVKPKGKDRNAGPNLVKAPPRPAPPTFTQHNNYHFLKKSAIRIVYPSETCDTWCVPIRYLLSVGNNNNNSVLKNKMPTFTGITFFKTPATTLCLGASAASTLRKNKEKSHKVFIDFAITCSRKTWNHCNVWCDPTVAVLNCPMQQLVIPSCFSPPLISQYLWLTPSSFSLPLL